MVWAQPINYNYSQTLVDLVSTKKWFEVEDYYQQHKDSIDNEFVKRWYLAQTGQVFNRPDEAINAYEQLIDNNPLHKDTPTLISLFGQPMLQLCADVQEYARGEELCRKLMTFIEKDTTINSDTIALYIKGFTQAIERFKQFPKEYPKLTLIKNKSDSLNEIKLLPDNKRNLYIDNTGFKTLYMNMEICNANFLTYFGTGGEGGLSINTDFFEKYKPCIPTEAEAKQVGNMTGSCNEASISKRYEYKCPQIDIKINDQGITLINDCSVAKDKENDNKFGATEGGFLGNAIFKYCKKAIFDFDNMVFSVSN